MPVDYSNGKIYKLSVVGCDEYYIGSTAEPTLARRLAYHKGDYKQWKKGKAYYKTSFKLFQICEEQNKSVEITLVKMAPCGCKDELRMIEQQSIEEYKEHLFNKRNAYGVNIEHEKQYKKEYYQANKQAVLQQQKEYYQANKQTVLQQRKEYNQANKAKLTEKHQCDCGGRYSTHNKSKHEKTQMHKNYIQNNFTT